MSFARLLPKRERPARRRWTQLLPVRSPPLTLSPVARGLLAVCALLLVAGFAAAAWMRPNDSGVGTHQQLGLPPCGLLTWTGVRCPSCGLTTSLSYLMDGEVVRSVRTQPVGLFIAAVSVLAIAACVDAAARGRWRLRPGPLLCAVAAIWAINGVAIGRWLLMLVLS